MRISDWSSDVCSSDLPSPGQSLIPEGSFMSYNVQITQLDELIRGHNGAWGGISAEAVARMRLQNRFKTGLDIARYTARIMRQDMAAYDANPTNYTQSLGCWHGFIGQQKKIGSAHG